MVASLLPLDPQGDIIILLLEPFVNGSTFALLLFQRSHLVLEELVFLITLEGLNIFLRFLILLFLIPHTLLALQMSSSLLSLLLQLLLRLLILHLVGPARWVLLSMLS